MLAYCFHLRINLEIKNILNVFVSREVINILKFKLYYVYYGYPGVITTAGNN